MGVHPVLGPASGDGRQARSAGADPFSSSFLEQIPETKRSQQDPRTKASSVVLQK